MLRNLPIACCRSMLALMARLNATVRPSLPSPSINAVSAFAWSFTASAVAIRAVGLRTEHRATLLDLAKRFQIRKILYDPFQLAASMQRLAKERLPVEEYPQTLDRLTAMSQQLYDLIMGQAFIAYPSEAMRLAVGRTVAVENHMKNDGHLGRCHLKGREGDAANVILTAVGHNLVLAWLSSLLRLILLALCRATSVAPALN
jgi:IS5 family transposase